VDKARGADNLVKLDNELREMLACVLACVLGVCLWGKSCWRGAT
jgi:hypothetical protein